MKPGASTFGHFRIVALASGEIEVQNLDHDSSQPPRLAQRTEPKWLHNSAGECIGRNPNHQPQTTNLTGVK